MKKLALIFITAVYMLSVAGIAVSQFYCCNQLKSVSFSLSSADQNTSKNKIPDDGCCKTTHQYFKVTDSHFASHTVSLSERLFSALLTSFPSFQFVTPQIQQAAAANNINAPPLISGTPIYIFNCTYRI